MELIADKTYTVDEYFDFEEKSEDRHEFVNGNLIEMPGESTIANEIAVNLTAILKLHVKSKPFKVYTQAVKLMLSEKNNYRYPDVMVVQADGVSEKFVSKPVLVAEVLSDGTEETDRGTKLLEYTEKETLQYYLLVSQEKMLVEVYSRNGDKWEWTHYEKPNQKIDLSYFQSDVRLFEIYEGVAFPNNPTTSVFT